MMKGKALLSAVEFIIKHRNATGDLYAGDEQAPLTHVIPNDWLDFVVEHRIISISANDLVGIFSVRRRTGMIISSFYLYATFCYRAICLLLNQIIPPLLIS